MKKKNTIYKLGPVPRGLCKVVKVEKRLIEPEPPRPVVPRESKQEHLTHMLYNYLYKNHRPRGYWHRSILTKHEIERICALYKPFCMYQRFFDDEENPNRESWTEVEAEGIWGLKQDTLERMMRRHLYEFLRKQNEVWIHEDKNELHIYWTGYGTCRWYYDYELDLKKDLGKESWMDRLWREIGGKYR